MLRLVANAIIVLLAGPVIAGLVLVLLPAFGYAPTLGRSAVDLSVFASLSETPGLSHSLMLSLACGLSTPLTALAIVMLFLAGAQSSRIGRWLNRAASPLLAVPHAAMAFGLTFLIAPSGMIVRALSPWLTGLEEPPDLLIVNDVWGLSMMAGLVIKEVPFLLLMSLASLPQTGAPERLALARTLGYRPVAAWLKAVLPALYPLIRLPVYAVVAYASSVVDVALILGPTNPPPLGVAILRWASDPDLDRLLLASAGAVAQLIVTLAAIGLWRLGEVLAGRCMRGWIRGGARSFGDRYLRWLGVAAMVSIVSISALGLLSLGAWSIAGYWSFPDALPTALTVRTWRSSLEVMGEPFANTTLIALLSTALALVATLAALEHEVRRGFRAGAFAMTILYLPMLMPAVSFLLGLSVAGAIIGVRPGLASVVFGHVLFVLPYTYLSLSEAYWRLDPRWPAIARTLGARPHSVFWRIRLPMLLTPLLAAAAVGIAVSVGQYLPTQVLGAGRVPTVTTEAVALASGGDRRFIGVWALVQALLPAAGFLIAGSVPRLVWAGRRQMRGAA